VHPVRYSKANALLTDRAGIVIVDLDDSDAEDTSEPSSVQVNSALLECLRSRYEPDFQTTSQASNALVLYRPVLPLAADQHIEDCRRELEEPTVESAGLDSVERIVEDDVLIDDVPPPEDDAMEIEDI
jgi:hypothetical protein